MTGNLYQQLPNAIPQEMFEELIRGEKFHLERIISLGHATAPGQWYDQDADEWVVLLTGAAKLLFKDETECRTLKPGDWLHIAAHRQHRVEWTDPVIHTVWLALHYECTATFHKPTAIN